MPLRRHRRAAAPSSAAPDSRPFSGDTAWLAAGCSQTEPLSAARETGLRTTLTFSADLDGDGVAEQILIEGNSGRLVITDGATVYRSREKWRVVEGSLGDTDRNGLLEVVTLLDGPDGRHLGLFAYMGGEYRERLVTECSHTPAALAAARH